MPLLDMIVVDACEKTFCIAFVFLTGEAEEDYLWALTWLRNMYHEFSIDPPSVILKDRCLACMNALSAPQCFPGVAHLLCIWHINRAVDGYCRPTFFKDKEDLPKQEEWKSFLGEWHDIIKSETEVIFNERLLHFKQTYGIIYAAEVCYLIETWLDPHKQRFVRAWANQILHFDQAATSRVEGVHQLIKSHYHTSQVDLFEAYRIIKSVLDIQLQHLNAKQDHQDSKCPVDLSKAVYGSIRGWVSHEAMRRVDKQRERLLRDHPPCTGIFTKTLGLPCAHIISIVLQRNEPLRLSHFHSHWHLQRDESPTIIIEPHK